jgi:hypothetical protein
MILLPGSISTSAITSFWIALGVFAITFLVLIYMYLMPAPIFLASCLTGIVLLVFLLLFKPSLKRVVYVYYKGINRRLLISFVRTTILSVVFYFIIFLNRLYGGRLQLSFADSDRTMWHRKIISNIVGGGGSGDIIIDDIGYRSWLLSLYRWIKETGNWWVLTLVPYMLMLSILDDKKVQTTPSSETYTLY